MKKGFTLIELLVVISIIGILSTIGISGFNSAQNRAKDAKRRADVDIIIKAFEAKYDEKNFSYAAPISSDFDNGKIPLPPQGGNYAAQICQRGDDINGFKICANLGKFSGDCYAEEVGERDCYCRTSSFMDMDKCVADGGLTSSLSIKDTALAVADLGGGRESGEVDLSFTGGSPSPNPSSTTTSQGTCTLTSATWTTSTNPVTEGITVYLLVNGAGGCTNKQVTFEIKENDAIIEGGSDDQVITQPLATRFTVNNALTTQGSWLAEFQQDCAGLCNPPEYYFLASVEGGNIIHSSDPLLSVNKPSSNFIDPSLPHTKVFVTSTLYSGNLGGLAGADARCQERANVANLGGTWKAWLSDTTTSAASRLEHSPNPYTLVNGRIIADNWEGLTGTGYLKSPIKINEFGNEAPPIPKTPHTLVATNKDLFGLVQKMMALSLAIAILLCVVIGIVVVPMEHLGE